MIVSSDCRAPGPTPPRLRLRGRRALRSATEQVRVGTAVLSEALGCWAMVEYVDGSHYLEGIIRAPELVGEPGGAEVPEARRGRYAYLGYVERVH